MSQIINFFGHWINKPASNDADGIVSSTRNASDPLQELNYLQEVVFKINAAGQWLFLNEKWSEYTGYSIDECLGKSWLSHVHPQDHDSCREYLRRVTKGQPESLSAEIRIITKENAFRWVKMRANVLPCENPQTFNLTGTLTDISSEKSENERQIANYRALFSLISNVPGMVYRCRYNRDWTMEFVSAGCADLTGYDATHITNSTSAWSEIIHQEAREYVWMTIQSAIQNQQPFELTYRITTAEGLEKWVWERGAGNFSANGELLGLEGLITDITDTKRQSLRIERDTLFDPDTHLATQHLFLNRIQHAIEIANESPNLQHDFSVAVINISQHSNPGSETSTDQKDKVAKEIGTRLNSILSPTTTVCRLNENTFGILLERCNTGGGNRLSRTIRSIQDCLKAPIILDQSTFYTKASIGVAQFNDHKSNSDIMRDANRASVQAKELGANKIEFADDQQNINMASILGTESELTKALDTGQLQLIYQPLMAPEKPNERALEIKIAWQHPRRGLLAAEHFYDHIDDLELTRKLGKFILNGINDLLVSLPENLRSNQIYLHGLGESVLNGELIRECVDTLNVLKNADNSAQPLTFIIDIDDRLLANLSHKNMAMLQQLHKHNIGIAATGLKAVTPYMELLSLPGIQAIKLDMAASPLNESSINTYNAMIACYHSLNINVIAEGVNTQEISTAIKTSDFDFLQGSQIALDSDSKQTK
ncbi:MAG: PAS domain-containing protein [Pseudomonadales bacterium]